MLSNLITVKITPSLKHLQVLEKKKKKLRDMPSFTLQEIKKNVENF